MEWYYIVLIVIGIILILFLFLEYILALILYKKSFTRVSPKENEEDLYNSLKTLNPWTKFIPGIIDTKKVLENLPYQRITITSYDGLKLQGYYYENPSKSDTYIISIHGYRGQCFQDGAIVNPFLKEDGYNFLYIDLRGHNNSEGSYIGFGIPDHKDLILWINYLDKLIKGKGNIFIHGLSMGAATSLLIVDKNLPKSVKGVIADSGFISPIEEIKHVISSNFHIPSFPLIYFLKMVVHHKAHYYIDECSTIDTVKSSKLPICFIHGDKDNFVPTRFTYLNYEACTSPKEIHIYQGVGHALSQLNYPDEYRKMFNDFINKYK